MTEKQPAPIWLNRIHSLLMTFALGLLLFHLGVYFIYAANLIQFPYDYDQGEGFELVDTVMFSHGEWPYQNTDMYPFYSSNYPPLYHVIAAPFVWFFGPAYWYGRFLSFLSTLVTAAAITYAVYRDSRLKEGNGHFLIAALSGLAFLASNFIYHIGPLFRQHIMMVMFETLAVVILANVNKTQDNTQRRRQLAIGIALIIAAGYTKQLAAITAITALSWLFIRQPKRAFVWGLILAVIGGGIFIWINWATSGEWWRQTIVANVNTFYPDQSIGLFRLWFSLHGFLLIPAVLMVVYELYFDRLSIYSIWFVVSALLGGIGSGTWGAGDSYFATSIAAMCILSGLFATRTLSKTWRFRENYLRRWFIAPFQRFSKVIMQAGIIAIPIIYLGYGVAVIHMPTEGPIFETVASLLNLQPNALNGFYDSAGRIAGGYADIGHFVTEEDIAAGHRIVEMMQETDKPVLSEEAGFSLAAGRDVITNPTQLLNLWRAGLWNGAELVSMIEEKAFGFLVLRAQFYPPDVLEAISRHYVPSEEIHMNGFDYIVMRPREIAP